MPSQNKQQSRAVNYEEDPSPTPGDRRNEAGDGFSPPSCWPDCVLYLKKPVSSPYLTTAQSRWLHRKYEHELRTIRLPLSRQKIDCLVEVKPVSDENHPAYGQFGLFATRDLSPGELIIPYIGYVHSSTASERAAAQATKPKDESSAGDCEETRVVQEHHAAESGQLPKQEIDSWDKSDYDLNLFRDEDIELAVDAAQMGNEARFCNDYRGVPSEIHSSGNKQFERSTKRSAKISTSPHESGGKSTSYALETAIPNAEFKDVWFEWSEDDSEVETEERVPEAIEALSLQDNRLVADRIITTGEVTRPSRKRKKRPGMRGVAIFVLPAGKAGKRKHGIRKDQEVLSTLR